LAAAEAGAAYRLGHGGASGTGAALGPDLHALLAQPTAGGDPILAHAAEDDGAAVRGKSTGQLIQQRLQRWLVCARPGPVLQLRLAFGTEAQHPVDRRYQDFPMLQLAALSTVADPPGILAPENLRQLVFEPRVDMLGIDKGHRRLRRQRIEKLLDRRRSAQGRPQQPDATLLAQHRRDQRGLPQRRLRRLIQQLAKLAPQPALPAHMVLVLGRRYFTRAQQYRHRTAIEQP